DRRSEQGDRRSEQGDRRTGPARVLKVDQASVDRLLDLVGQLVVAKNGLPFLAAAAEQEWNARALGKQIKDQYGVVDRITEELQAAVMDVRMLPMAVVFARFPRMIRDLARSLGKQVVLEQEGQDTAADKDVIEMLGDPLVHVVRNSLDHGIERPDERVAAGKPAQATIRLRAVQEPDAIVIDIIDDGRGIDPGTIKRKAYERGLITEEQLETLNDQDAVNLVFLPGFSTADTISDVSGRGVGMDAVRASVQAIGGSVRVFSTPGRGSQVSLRVPLSMAVSRVMIVTVAGQRFGVPVDLVIETMRIPRARIGRVEHQDVIVLRNSVVPLVDLRQTLQMTTQRLDQELVSVLVVRPDGDDIGLIVDSFQEGAEVIVKPMQGVLAGSRHFCGTALMGDGSVLLVLDVKEVLAGAGDPV
ncbi:MAG TPA: chemotaxis protein CheA, partial [Kineosporiaceae bacterium]|nr:chemotaxis protein CheA [Kineosporiaceae bacterium]